MVLGISELSIERRRAQPKAAPTTPMQAGACIEALVAKTLATNPELYGDRDVDSVLEEIRTTLASPVSATSDRSAARSSLDPRAGAVGCCVAEAKRRFDGHATGIQDALRKLNNDLATLRQQTLADLLEVVGALLKSGADRAACRRELHPYRDFLERLGVSEDGLLRQAR